MPANVLEVKDKVQRWLTEFLSRIEVDRDGNFTFQHGTSRVFVSVRDWAEDHVVVRVYAPTNFDVPPSPELFRFVATNADSRIFGRLSATERDTGVMIAFDHVLLGDTLDPDELRLAVIAVAGTAEGIDKEIRDKFGGRVFYDED